MNTRLYSCEAVHGMTLPELMVGMAVGLFVATVAISTFISTRTLNVVNSSSTRMTENARLATETLHTDLRSAGFAGCRTLEQRLDGPPLVVLAGGLNAGFLVGGNSGVLGYTATGTGHSPALPTALSDAAPNRLLNSDILTVRVPADNVALGITGSMASQSGNLQLGTVGPIAVGDVALVANCKAAALFQVTGVASNELSHDAGSLIPGNSTTDLGHVFRSDATVYRMQTRHYYVAPGIRAGTNSLWRLTVPAPAGASLGEPEHVRF